MTVVDIPRYDKYRTYDESAKGKARHSRVYQTRYLSRPFVAWDGEGVTTDDGRHLYVTLANSRGDRITDPDGLPTFTIFDFLLSHTYADERSIHVVYGGGYDANCWLADLDKSDLDGIYDHESWKVGRYRIRWRRGKWFRVSAGNQSVLIYDVMPFFQVPFTTACRSYLGEDYPQRDRIERNKRLRSSFTMADLVEIQTYNDAELSNLVSLCNELRERLDKVGLRLSRWDGPGAVAASLMKRERVKDALNQRLPDRVSEASRYAYAGGRFEVIRCGFVRDPAYQYDVNSAYPAAFRHVPNLAYGRWAAQTNPDIQGLGSSFALCYLRFRTSTANSARPCPLFRRHANGAISYPLNTEGWYWSIEAEAALEWTRRYGGNIECLEALVYIPDNPHDRPFGFIDDLYRQRALLKKRGDGAHVGLKLGLNSLYGKTCQQVGAKMIGNRWKIPAFHQLEYAGYVTASCRAQLLYAAMQDIDSVIAFETDALFTSRPMNLPIGSGLGEWERTEYESLLYAQSGVYFGRTPNGYHGLDYGTAVDKTRGVDRGSLTRDEVVRAMESPRADRRVTASLTRFIGYGLARRTDYDKWRCWQRTPKSLSCEPTTGKRWHLVCPKCDSDDDALTLDVWHETFCPFLGEETNHPYPIAWANPDPRMTKLEELRNRQAEEMAEWYD